jgi:hypothetical protein
MLFRHCGLNAWFDKLTTKGIRFLFMQIDYWMPVDDPVFSGDQVRHDGQKCKGS